ncbi:MAG: sterol desaturase family protein [Ekhidna sp.]|nr:sterol desaturase family protein [Ekhidna sp.]
MTSRSKNSTSRLYQNDLMETLSRSPFWLPLVVFVPVICFLTYNGFSSLGSGNILKGILLAIVGFFFWTLIEYVIHRFLFHYEAKSKFWKRFIYVVHGIHHDHPDDLTRLVFPVSVSIPMFVIIYFLTDLIPWSQNAYHAIFFAFFMLSYLCYDMIHYATHATSFENKLFMTIKKHHMSHHFQKSDSKYGVSSSLWDFIFRSAGDNRESK